MGSYHARVAGLALLGWACAHSPAPTLAAPPPEAPVTLDPPEARVARGRLVERVAVSHHITDSRVLGALRAVPRHLFVPATPELAYTDRPLPIGHGQTISQPAVVAMMTQALELRGDECVLEIGTGSGYQAAVLSLLARQVYSIEIVPELGEKAGRLLAGLGYHNVTVRIGDGYQGWPDAAPFDRVVLTAAPQILPAALLEQLQVGGVLVAPVGARGSQRLRRWRKTPAGILEEDLGPIRFVPMVPVAT